jgi:hypothetical protein
MGSIKQLNLSITLYNGDFVINYTNIALSTTLNSLEARIINDHIGSPATLLFYTTAARTAITNKAQTLQFYGIIKGGSTKSPVMYCTISNIGYQRPIVVNKNIVIKYVVQGNIVTIPPTVITNKTLITTSTTNFQTRNMHNMMNIITSSNELIINDNTNLITVQQNNDVTNKNRSIPSTAVSRAEVDLNVGGVTVLVSDPTTILDIRTYVDTFIPPALQPFTTISYTNYFNNSNITPYVLNNNENDNDLPLNDVIIEEAFSDCIYQALSANPPSDTSTEIEETYPEINCYFYITVYISFNFPKITVNVTCDDIRYSTITIYNLTYNEMITNSMSYYISLIETNFSDYYDELIFYYNDVISTDYTTIISDFPDITTTSKFNIVLKKNNVMMTNQRFYLNLAKIFDCE